MSKTPQQAVSELQNNCGSLMLATLSEDGQPHCSYTPYCQVDNHYFILISELAAHTRNVLSHPQLDIMLIEDEASASQLFARNRLSLTCTAKRIADDDARYNDLMDKFEQRHGKTVGMLRQLPDFHLIQLQPQSGRFVMGFGQAYELAGENLDQFVLSRSA